MGSCQLVRIVGMQELNVLMVSAQGSRIYQERELTSFI